MLSSIFFRFGLIALALITITTATPIPGDEASAAGEFCFTDRDCPPVRPHLPLKLASNNL